MNKYIVIVEVLVEARDTTDARLAANHAVTGTNGIDYMIVDVERQGK